MAKIVRKIVSVATASKPVGPYNQAVIAGNTMYISGQIGMDTSGSMVSGGVEKEAIQCLENMKAILAGAGADMKNVVKTTILLKNMSDWPAVNNVYTKYFTKNYPARAAYAVVDLPKGALVEIEGIAVIGEIVEKPLS